MLFALRQHIAYLFRAHYRRGHHVHSPYTYRLFTHVLFEEHPYYSFPRIRHFEERTRPALGSRCATDKPKYTQILQRLAAFIAARTILELGTGRGITTMYLAANDSRSSVLTLPASTADVDRLADNFKLMGYANIRIADHPDLAAALNRIGNVDMLLVRASQGVDRIYDRFLTVLPYTGPRSVLIFDNIHATPALQDDWYRIVAHPATTLTLDLFRLGIVWLNHDLQKQHYIVKY